MVDFFLSSGRGRNWKGFVMALNLSDWGDMRDDHEKEVEGWQDKSASAAGVAAEVEGWEMKDFCR